MDIITSIATIINQDSIIEKIFDQAAEELLITRDVQHLIWSNLATFLCQKLMNIQTTYLER